MMYEFGSSACGSLMVCVALNVVSPFVTGRNPKPPAWTGPRHTYTFSLNVSVRVLPSGATVTCSNAGASGFQSRRSKLFLSECPCASVIVAPHTRKSDVSAGALARCSLIASDPGTFSQSTAGRSPSRETTHGRPVRPPISSLSTRVTSLPSGEIVAVTTSGLAAFHPAASDWSEPRAVPPESATDARAVTVYSPFRGTDASLIVTVSDPSPWTTAPLPAAARPGPVARIVTDAAPPGAPPGTVARDVHSRPPSPAADMGDGTPPNTEAVGTVPAEAGLPRSSLATTASSSLAYAA